MENQTKICNKCGVEKEITEYHKQPNGKFGVGTRCKLCLKEYHKKHYIPTGNPVSAKKDVSRGPRLKYDDIIERAEKVHGDKYDYSKLNYNSPKEKVTIICDEHGEFNQRLHDHLNGAGCKICGNRDKINPLKLNTAEFVRRANEMHGEFFDYSQVEYVNDNTKVDIICPIHGVFKQLPGSHARDGQGCPRCRMSKGERSIMNILNKNNISYIHQKCFEGCRYIRKLPFDFYLPKLNIMVEYDGIQHFEPVRFNGMDRKEAEKLFCLTKLKDSIKDGFCIQNNIKLYRIDYTQNIEEEIYKILKDNNVQN